MTLTDTGTVIALVDDSDSRHADCDAALGRLSLPLTITCYCLTEAMYLLGKGTGIHGQRRLWRIIQDGTLAVIELDTAQQERMRQFMEKYADRPCDLADASLLAYAEAIGATRVFSIDSDFYIYRLNDGRVLQVVPGAG